MISSHLLSGPEGNCRIELQIFNHELLWPASEVLSRSSGVADHSNFHIQYYDTYNSIFNAGDD